MTCGWCWTREGALPPGRAAGFISPVASALDAAHGAGLVHRDVKPANILVDARPDRPDHVYLSDFGVSKGALSSVSLTGAGQFLGTPDYSAPEQIQGRAVDGRTDQYALACVAYQLLTGAVPFERDQGMAVLLAHLSEPPPSLGSRRPDLPGAADQVLARALAKVPEKRYGSCRDFADALREALGLAPYISLGSAAAPDQLQPQIAAPQPGFSRPAGAGTGPAAVPADPAAAATIESAPGGPAVAVERGQRERARRETRQAARQQAEEPARQEALRDQVHTPRPARRKSHQDVRAGPGPGEKAPRAPGRRPASRALPRRSVILVAGAGIAVIGLLAVIFVVPGTHNPSSTRNPSVTSRLRWSYPIGGAVFPSPAVAGGTVYIGSGDHKVYALDAATGHLRWSYLTGGVPIQPGGGGRHRLRRQRRRRVRPGRRHRPPPLDLLHRIPHPG